MAIQRSAAASGSDVNCQKSNLIDHEANHVHNPLFKYNFSSSLSPLLNVLSQRIQKVGKKYGQGHIGTDRVSEALIRQILHNECAEFITHRHQITQRCRAIHMRITWIKSRVRRQIRKESDKLIVVLNNPRSVHSVEDNFKCLKYAYV